MGLRDSGKVISVGVIHRSWGPRGLESWVASACRAFLICSVVHSDSGNLMMSAPAQKALSGNPVCDYCLEWVVQNGWFLCWCDHGVTVLLDSSRPPNISPAEHILSDLKKRTEQWRYFSGSIRLKKKVKVPCRLSKSGSWQMRMDKVAHAIIRFNALYGKLRANQYCCDLFPIVDYVVLLSWSCIFKIRTADLS